MLICFKIQYFLVICGLRFGKQVLDLTSLDECKCPRMSLHIKPPDCQKCQCFFFHLQVSTKSECGKHCGLLQLGTSNEYLHQLSKTNFKL